MCVNLIIKWYNFYNFDKNIIKLNSKKNTWLAQIIDFNKFLKLYYNKL